MTGRRLSLAALALACVAVLSPLGLYALRLGGWSSLWWVFGTWWALVVAAGIASWRAQRGGRG